MENENLNDYKLKINPKQVFDLTTEQEGTVKDALFHSINFLKRPAMIFAAGIADEKDRLTNREREMCKYFSEVLQNKIIFKWIDKPENDDDILDGMEEIQLYFSYPSVEELDMYTHFQIKYKFPGWELSIKRSYAWMNAIKSR